MGAFNLALYVGGKKINSLFYQGKRITSLYYQGKKIYGSYVKDGTVLWGGNGKDLTSSPIDATLLVSLDRVKTGLVFDVPESDFNLDGQSYGGYNLISSIAYNDSGTYTIPKSKLITGKMVEVASFTGGGSFNLNGYSSQNTLLTISGVLAVQLVDSTHLKISRTLAWDGSAVDAGVANGTVVSGQGAVNIAQIRSY